MSRVGELCVRSTREVRSAAPSPYGGTSPNGCCFGFCLSSMVCVREREVYPNAPIVLMAVEVRHPSCELLEPKQVTQLSAHIRGSLPLPSETNEVSVVVQTSPNSLPVQQQVVSTFPRWTSRDKRTALTIRQDSLVVETTDYGSYDRIRTLLDVALRARRTVAPPAGVERVGLRYIDEIRVPTEDGGGSPVWDQWVDSSLLGPTRIGTALGLAPAVSEGLVVFSGENSRALVLRYGEQIEYVVPSTPELRRPLPPPGPLFKLDIDSFWQAADEVPEFDVDLILNHADALHEPVRDVFESLITDRLREEVLRRG